MKRFYILVSAVCLAMLFAFQPVLAQPGPDIDRDRLAQTGMKFLSVPVHPAAAAMANAATASHLGSASLFGNPAGMAGGQHRVSATLSQVDWIAEYKYGAGSLSFQPGDGRYGTVGVSFVNVDYGDMLGTIRRDNEQGFEDTGTFSPNAMAFGLGYARALTDRFYVGGQVKIVRQSLGSAIVAFDEGGAGVEQDNDASVTAFDFGVIYNTGFRSLTLGLTARNFAREVEYAEESFELPLTFKLGMSMDLMDLYAKSGGGHALLLSVDAERPRDYAEQLRVGAEYNFTNTLFIRGGYVFPTDEEGFNAGGGVHVALGGIDLRADYAYTQFGRLGNVNRIGFQFGL